MPSGTRRSIAAAAGAFASRFRNGSIHGTNLALTPWAPLLTHAHSPWSPLCVKRTNNRSEGLCRREKRGTVERDGYRGPHHREQNAHASRAVEPLERTHQISKRPRQDTNCLSRGERGIEPRQICFVGV